MKAHYLSFFFFFLQTVAINGSSKARPTLHRRALHQPLFPFAPPPESALTLPSPSPPPAPSDLSSGSNDQPFFHESPSGSVPARYQPPPSSSDVTSSIPVAAPPSRGAKTAAIAISVGIVTLGMLSALAFFLYRHRSNSGESLKLVGGPGDGYLDDTRAPPSSFFYIGTVEPSRSTAGERRTANGANSSPYRKLNSIKMWDRYRPSPELQPLPPLSKPPAAISPAPSSSSGKESQETGFHTPQGSSVVGHDPTVWDHAPAKRASPRSRLSLSSSKVGQSPVPPSPPPPTSPFHQPPPLISSKRPKFSKLPPPPPPPPPPLTSNPQNVESSFTVMQPEKLEEDDPESVKPKLKPLHWDKVRATSTGATVWDQLKSSSFQVNEDMMESLFCFNSANPVSKETGRKTIFSSAIEKETRVLDPKKSQNIAILLRALNVTKDEVAEALLDGNPECLGAELLETLMKMAPTKEEEIKLGEYRGDVSKLGSAERFLKAVLDVPFAFKRVEAMLYRANFDTEVKYMRKAFQTLEAASEELKSSRLFLKLLEAVLKTGNRMNVGTNRGEATAFKLETLLKLVDVKGADGKTTLLHFVIQEIIRSECDESTNGNLPNNGQSEERLKKQGSKLVAGLSRDLVNVKKAANMDSDVLSSYVSKLEMGLEKVRSVSRLEKRNEESKFFNSMNGFLNEAEGEIIWIKADEKKAMWLVKGVTEYFQGNAAKEEAHPFRIFMIVRDFLSILDQVCKEVGRIQGGVIGSARSFRITSNVSLPVLNRYNTRRCQSSDEDSSSS